MNHRDRRVAAYKARGLDVKANIAAVSMNNRSRRSRGKQRVRMKWRWRGRPGERFAEACVRGCVGTSLKSMTMAVQNLVTEWEKYRDQS